MEGRNKIPTKARSKVLRYGKKRKGFCKAKKENKVNHDLSVTVHNSAPVNNINRLFPVSVNSSVPVNVNNSSVPVTNNFVNETHTIDDGQTAGPSSYVSTNVSPVKTRSYLKFRKLVNRSQQKLSRNSCSLSGRTRYQKEYIGEKKMIGEKYPAMGYKVQDIEILQEVLRKAVICRECTSKKSQLNILQRPSQRKGLAESVILKCSWCGQETNFSTSSKMKVNNVNNRNAYDVNVRSTFASNDGERRTLKILWCNGLTTANYQGTIYQDDEGYI